MKVDSDKEVSVVMPIFRSAATIRALVERVLAVLEATGRRHEIILVEDGSPDDSWQVLTELQSEHPREIVAVQLMRNYGQHNALMCGFRHCRGKYLITMDDDGQNPPEEIPRLLQKIETENWDLVYGSYGEKKHRAWRNLGSGLVNAFYRRVFKTSVTITSFRAIRRELAESILSYSLNFTFIDGLLAWNTQRIGQVQVEHDPRRQGESSYTLGKLMLLAFNLFTNFSLIPLQLASICGLTAAALGIATGLYYLAMYFSSSINVPGYASIIITVLFLGGLQLSALGIIGEYLGRLHLNVNRKPQYVERQMLGHEEESQGTEDVVRSFPKVRRA
jgi:undecaprenyl-phosphate 4-deoxy-4-formamido-L-arabinose transferase